MEPVLRVRLVLLPLLPVRVVGQSWNLERVHLVWMLFPLATQFAAAACRAGTNAQAPVIHLPVNVVRSRQSNVVVELPSARFFVSILAPVSPQ